MTRRLRPETELRGATINRRFKNASFEAVEARMRDALKDI